VVSFKDKSAGDYWDLKRVLMHIPHGLGSALLFLIFGPHPMYLFAIGFFFYEWIEDWRIEDHAYHDLRGWLIGFPAGFLLAIGIKFLFINVWSSSIVTRIFWL